MRFIVISCQDSQADELLEEGIPRLHPSVDVVGMFQVPTKFCDPSDGHRGKKTQSGFTRGKKYGWWVCGACKKPTRGWATNMNAVLSAARNLLSQGQDTLGAARAVLPEEATTPNTFSVTGQGSASAAGEGSKQPSQ